MENENDKYDGILSLVTFILFQILIIPFSLYAQQNSPQFKTFNVEEGLSYPYVKAIYEDENGLMWFGTGDGLNKFDGYNFKVFKNNPGEKKTISNSNINAIVPLSDGRILIGTLGGGLNIFDKSLEIFSQPGFLQDDRLNFILTIFKSKDGLIWIGTANQGLFVHNPKNHELNKVIFNTNGNEIGPGNEILSIVEDSIGNLWIGSLDGGLSYYDRKKDTLKFFLHDPENPKSITSNKIRTILIDRNKRLWVGTWGGGLNMMYSGTNEFHPVFNSSESANGIGQNEIQSLVEADDGSIWVGTDVGFSIIKKLHDEFEVFRHDPFNSKSIGGNSVKVAFKDSKNRIWLGTFSGGVSLYDKRLQQFRHFRKTDRNGLSDNNISAILEISPQKILVGTDGGGLNIFDRKSGTFSHFKHENGNPKSIAGDKVKTIFKDSKGRIWIGLWGKGLDLFDVEKGTFRHFNTQKPPPYGPGSDNIISIDEDKQGILWIGTFDNGLNQFNPEKETFNYFFEPSLSASNIGEKYIWTVLNDSKDRLWLGSEIGTAYLFDKKSKKLNLIPLYEDSLAQKFSIYQIIENSNGEIWLATSNKGILRYDEESNSLQPLLPKLGLNQYIINSIEEDLTGKFWISTNNGLILMNLEESKLFQFKESDGLQSLQFIQRASRVLQSGEIIFGGRNGFNLFSPDSVKLTGVSYPLVFTDFQIFNKPVKVGENGSPLKQDIGQTKSITLNHEQSLFSIEYAYLNYATASDIEYAYKLEGFVDDSWQFVGNDRKVTYTNLEPKTYIFRVKASQGNSIWLDNEIALEINILAPWWETWWFRSLAVIIFFTAIFLIVYSRVRFLERQRSLLKKMVSSRTEVLLMQTEEIAAQNEELQANQEELTAQNHELETTLERLKETQSQLIQSEKMASLGVLTAGIAHEINNPVNFIKNGVVGIKKAINHITYLFREYEKLDIEDENISRINDYKQKINFEAVLDLMVKTSENITNGIDRTTEIIKGLTVFSRPDEGKLKYFDLNEGINSTIQILKHEFKDRITIEKKFDILPKILGYPGKINQVLVNVLVNAIHAIEGEGKIIISTFKSGDQLVVSIKDSGSGMDTQTISQAFDPFYTTKEVGRGTGLGLYISMIIIKEHQGEIKVKSEIGKGTEFIISLPLKITKSSEVKTVM